MRHGFESFIRAVRTKSLDFIILYRTVVGRTSDGRRTAVRPSSDRCPTGVRRPSDGRPTAVRKISAEKKFRQNIFAEKFYPKNWRICDQDSLEKQKGGCHFSKNYGKRPRIIYDWVWLWNDSWDVCHNSLKSGVLNFSIFFHSVRLEDTCVLAGRHFCFG